MTLLTNLSSRLKVVSWEPAASRHEIDSLVEFSRIQVPEELLEFHCEMTEVEIEIDGSNYLRLWSPAGCIEMNSAYEIQRHVPNSLGIGDNEGGMVLLLVQGEEGVALFTCGFGDLDTSSLAFVAPSLRALLHDGSGLDELL